MPITLRIKKNPIILGFFLLCTAVILGLSVRGNIGNPNIYELNTPYWTIDGPLELSPERGRFALLYSLVEYKSFIFPLEVARFAVPDLGYINGNYVSLFAPGVSYILIPGYILGEMFGVSQVGTFAIIAIFALLNCYLIYEICRLIGSNFQSSVLAFLVFIFATPAYAYAVTIYQHHISTFLILASLYLLIRFNNFVSLGMIWFFICVSLSVDYPNLFMMLPIGIYALGKLVSARIVQNKLELNIKFLYLFSVVFAIAPIYFFFWFNKNSYGNPMQLSGGVTQVRKIDDKGQPADTNFTAGLETLQTTQTSESSSTAVGQTESSERNVLTFFDTRYILNGFFILFFSPDRGIIYFAPIIMLGFIGVFTMYKKRNSQLGPLLAVLISNIAIYTMWGDPWGGWAFGARYLIPAYAILAIFLSAFLTNIKAKYLYIVVFGLFVFSAYVNTAGALTTNAIPPKVEVLKLEELSGIEQKYNVKRNLDFLYNNNSKSFVFNTYLSHKLNAFVFFKWILSAIALLVMPLFVSLILKRNTYDR